MILFAILKHTRLAFRVLGSGLRFLGSRVDLICDFEALKDELIGQHRVVLQALISQQFEQLLHVELGSIVGRPAIHGLGFRV